MKWEKWIYLFAFMCGVVFVNICANRLWTNQTLLNRYSLAALSFREIVYKDYFLRILFLRFKTVIAIWMGTKILPKRMIVNGFAITMSAFWGSILAILILENGIWGVLFCVSAIFPQILFYTMAFVLWKNLKEVSAINISKVENNMKKIFVLILVGVGCICEAFISPVIMQNVIKY